MTDREQERGRLARKLFSSRFINAQPGRLRSERLDSLRQFESEQPE
jgi:hypothetical protein